MTDDNNWPRTVYFGLIAATLLALVFSTEAARQVLSVQGAAVAALLIAFIKVRFIALDFMELRNTPMQRAFDAWLLVVGAVAIALMLR